MVELSTVIGMLHLAIVFLVITDIRKNSDLFSGALRWFLYIFIIFVPIGGALLYLFLVARRSGPSSRCPHCDEPMPEDATVCQQCGYGSPKRSARQPKRCRECGETFDTFRGLHKHKQEHE